jgi:Domain of unknown function (DUF4838)
MSLGLLFAFVVGTTQQSETCTLVSNNRPVASIVIPTENPEMSINIRAAEILQSSVEKMTGITLPIIKSNRRNPKSSINIGFPEKSVKPSRGYGGELKIALTSPHPELINSLKSDGFGVYTSGNSLSIVSGGRKGAIYGVVHVLEKYFGCRCYSPTAYVFPQQSTLKVKNVFDIENPAIEFRAVNGEFSKDPDYLDWTKGNSTSEMYGAGYSVHTFEKLVPPKSWLKSHPQYFALIKNRRSPIQLCPSNPEIIPIVVAKLKQEIAAQPSKHVWSVSQNDNDSFCQCDRCLGVNSEEGSPGGAQLRFVNEIAKQFPKQTISTLAYQWSRKAPKVTKPEKNVQIVLCTIEADRSQPIETNPTAQDFVKDINNWKRITKNIYLWDYTVNFNHMMAPFPNLFTLQQNIQFFAKNGANQIFEQTNTSPGHEFSELKSYLLAKLLWNPKADAPKIIREFCLGYYGPAGEHIENYIYNLTTKMQESKTRLDIFDSPVTHANDFLSERNLDDYGSQFFLALAMADDPIHRQRIFTARLSLDYVQMLIAASDVFGPRGFYKFENGMPMPKISIPGAFDEFLETATKNNVKSLSEQSFTPQQFRDSMVRLTSLNIAGNIAFGTQVSAVPLPSRKYSAGALSKLSNGVLGGSDFRSEWIGWDGIDFEFTIDLGTKRSLSSIETNSLSEFTNWILHPDKVECFVSEDGKGYLPWGSEKLDPLHKSEPRLHHFSFPNPLGPYEHGKYQYVMFRVASAKKLPTWHQSAGGSTWVFLDEVIIR